MKKLLLIPLAFLSLAACETVQPIINSTQVCQVGTATLIDDKALYSANLAYNLPAQAYVAADIEGKLPPTLKAWAQPKLIEMYRLLGVIKAAKGTFNCDINSLKVLSDEVTARLPK